MFNSQVDSSKLAESTNELLRDPSESHYGSELGPLISDPLSGGEDPFSPDEPPMDDDILPLDDDDEQVPMTDESLLFDLPKQSESNPSTKPDLYKDGHDDVKPTKAYRYPSFYTKEIIADLKGKQHSMNPKLEKNLMSYHDSLSRSVDSGHYNFA